MTCWAFLRWIGYCRSTWKCTRKQRYWLKYSIRSNWVYDRQVGLQSRDSGSPDPQILAWFLIPKSRDCRGPNLGFRGCTFLLKRRSFALYSLVAGSTFQSLTKEIYSFKIAYEVTNHTRHFISSVTVGPIGNWSIHWVKNGSHWLCSQFWCTQFWYRCIYRRYRYCRYRIVSAF